MAVRVIRAPNASIEIQAYKVRVVVENDFRGCLDTGASGDEKDGEDDNDALSGFEQ
jgi:hypothetical protein